MVKGDPQGDSNALVHAEVVPRGADGLEHSRVLRSDSSMEAIDNLRTRANKCLDLIRDPSSDRLRQAKAREAYEEYYDEVERRLQIYRKEHAI